MMAIQIQNDEAVLNNIIETKGAALPNTIEDIIKFFEFSRTKADAWRSLSANLSKIEDQKAAYESALRSAQQWGAAMLYSKMRLGEATRAIGSAQGQRSDLSNFPLANGKLKSKGQILKEQGINDSIASQAERLAAASDLVDAEIERARRSGDTPSQSKIFGELRKRQKEKDLEEAKKEAAEENEKSIKDYLNKNNGVVKEYLEDLKNFKSVMEEVVDFAKHGVFAPESIHLIRKRHEGIIKLFRNVEDIIQA